MLNKGLWSRAGVEPRPLKCVKFFAFAYITERIFKNQVFTLYVTYIGTMPRLVQIETWFFEIIHCISICSEQYHRLRGNKTFFLTFFFSSKTSVERGQKSECWFTSS